MKMISEVASIEKYKVKHFLYNYESEEEMSAHIAVMQARGYEKEWSDNGVLKAKYYKREEL